VGAVLFHALTGGPPFDEETYNRLISRLMNEDPPKLGSVKPGLPEWLVTAVEGALQRDVTHRWQSARTMKDVLQSKGKAPIELDWEIHEDATVRTESMFGEKDSRPATLRLLRGRDEPSIEIDLGSEEIPIGVPLIPDSAFDVGGGPTIKSEIPPAFLLEAMSPSGKKRKTRTSLLVGVVFAIIFTSAVMLIAGMLFYAHVIAR
jgi:serine/threonine protein kinase